MIIYNPAIDFVYSWRKRNTPPLDKGSLWPSVEKIRNRVNCKFSPYAWHSTFVEAHTE